MHGYEKIKGASSSTLVGHRPSLSPHRFNESRIPLKKDRRLEYSLSPRGNNTSATVIAKPFVELMTKI
jgi:hypothetical protein